MNPALTQFGDKMSHLTGVRAIMKDIKETLQAGVGQQYINLSPGNPVILPEVEELWREYTTELLNGQDFGNVVCRYGDSQGYEPLIEAVVNFLWREYTTELLNGQDFGNVVCRYGDSQGYEPLIEAVVNFFNQRYKLSLTNRNILITPGSQSLYF